LAKKFTFVGALTDLTTPSRARTEAKSWLKKLASTAARHFVKNPLGPSGSELE
jgi:hypothetical protein